MTPTYLLDSGLLIALENEVASGREGDAHRTLASLPKGRFFISPMTVAEVLEGAEDVGEASRELATYQQTTIGWQVAMRCALNQARAQRRMGENDAWQAALAMLGSHKLIGRDSIFADRPGLDYHDFTRT